MLRTKQLVLLDTVLASFDIEENNFDPAILYEVTGYQTDIPGDREFWANYADNKVRATNLMSVNDDHGD